MVSDAQNGTKIYKSHLFLCFVSLAHASQVGITEG